MDFSLFFLLFAAFILWGSWANTIKLARGIRFEFYYLDFLGGLLLVTLCLLAFFASEYEGFSVLVAKEPRFVILSIVSGVLFNIATFFLVASISLIGLTYSYMLCFGIALITDSLALFVVSHFANVLFFVAGIFLVLLALFWIRLSFQESRQQLLVKKLSYLVVVSGILMGLFHPILVNSVTILGTENISSFFGFTLFSLGVLGSNLVTFPFFMKRPVFGHSLENITFIKMPLKSHIWGLLGGSLWAVGFYLNLVTHKIAGYTLFFTTHEASILMAFSWGMLFWKEIPYKSPSYKHGVLAFVSYLLGALLLGSSL